MKLLDTSVVIDIGRGTAGDRLTKLDDHGRHAIGAATIMALRWKVTERCESGTDACRGALKVVDWLCTASNWSR